MIALSTKGDFRDILEVINDGALAYKGIIPGDRWCEPYMSEQHLQEEIDDGVQFWHYSDNDKIVGVMGIQDKRDLYLIRHAYVRTYARNKGIGGRLLQHLTSRISKPVLIGTWAAATWAIAFYEKHDFQLVSFEERESLLRTYWDIPIRQIETSVVLASSDWTRSSRNG